MSKKTQNQIILIPFESNKNKIPKKYKIMNQNYISTKNTITILIMKYILFLNLFFLSILNNDLNMIDHNFSIIKLKILGKGAKNIFNNEASQFQEMYYPNEVYINDIRQNVVNHSYYFNENDNLIELKWNNNINNTGYMFFECSDIIEIDLSNFDTSQVTDMSCMFDGCVSLTSLNLSNFDTSRVIDMASMFRFCTSLAEIDVTHFNTKNVKFMSCMFDFCLSLKSLNISNFDTSQVIDMNGMFSECSSLTSLNLSNFNTSQVEFMHYLFSDCYLLTSLDISNFNTSNVLDMNNMFANCVSLTSLNLSNFDTSQVIDMEKMFFNCTSLTSLDLSSLDSSQVEWMNYMFDGCLYLEYINMKNFKEDNLRGYHDMFNNVPENVVLCLDDNNNIQIISQLNDKSCYIIDCSDNWEINQEKMLYDIGQCIDNCKNNLEYKYEYNNKCYKNCEKGLIDDTNKCKCELDKCLTCPDFALSKGLCIKCNDNYYQMENDPSNIGDYINCYKEIYGYYLDKVDLLFKKCYETCDTCEIKGNNINHNCLKCNNDYSFEIIINNYTNCYKNCSFYHYFNNENNFICTNNFSCPDEYPLLIKDKIECQKHIGSSNITEMMKNILDSYIKNETEDQEKEEIKYYDMILKNIENCFTSGEYNTSLLEIGIDDIFEYSNLLITLTTSSNQKNNINNTQISTIDLAECEILLRGYYNMTNNEIIYIKKIDIKQEGMKIPKIEYDVYRKSLDQNLEKLNLSICVDTKVYLYISVSINENIDVLNSSSGYYNDLCYTVTTESGTDITLDDRKKEFIDGNKTICQDDCDFFEYIHNIKKANCKCNAQHSSSLSFEYMKINTTKLLENFVNIKNIININILICFQQLFSKEGIKNNIGNFIIIIIVLFHITSIFLFYMFHLYVFKIQIQGIFLVLKRFGPIKAKLNDIKEKKYANEIEKPINININIDNYKKTIN